MLVQCLVFNARLYLNFRWGANTVLH
jgi:hypothetical protein